MSNLIAFLGDRPLFCGALAGIVVVWGGVALMVRRIR